MLAASNLSRHLPPLAPHAQPSLLSCLVITYISWASHQPGRKGDFGRMVVLCFTQLDVTHGTRGCSCNNQHIPRWTVFSCNEKIGSFKILKKKTAFLSLLENNVKKVQLGRNFVRASQLRDYIFRSQVLELSVASQKTPCIVLVLTSTNTVTIEPCFEKFSYQALGNKLANGYRS